MQHACRRCCARHGLAAWFPRGPSVARRVTFPERIYRSLLLCYPAEFRYEYGPEMVRLFRDRCDAFSGAIARDQTGFVMSAGSEMERVSGELVSANYFSVLGVGATLGRVFAKEDARAPVAVLSYAFWQRRFGRDPSIIGK